jgi:hypothetical protein
VSAVTSCCATAPTANSTAEAAASEIPSRCTPYSYVTPREPAATRLAGIGGVPADRVPICR